MNTSPRCSCSQRQSDNYASFPYIRPHLKGKIRKLGGFSYPQGIWPPSQLLIFQWEESAIRLMACQKWCHILHFCLLSSSRVSLFSKKKSLQLRRFPINYKVRFEFRPLSVARLEWNSIFQKEDNVAKYTQIFGDFFAEVFFPFNVALGISRIFGWMVRISKIQQFPEFLETFQGKFLYHLPLFSNFRKF